MDTIKGLLAKWATPLLAKFILRGITYGTAIVYAKAGVDAPPNDTQAQVANYAAAAVAAVVGLVIDYYQQKFNKAEKPPKK